MPQGKSRMAMAVGKSLFITGAGGFVGLRLVQRMVSSGFRQIYCLSRKENIKLSTLAAKHNNLIVINADLFDIGRYKDALEHSDIAVHLAAVTGKASSETYFHINTKGTAFFTDQCRQAHIRGVVHFSTIAVNFEDIAGYPYARSKLEAETIVAKSGLRHVIVRPTIVFGCHSPIWQNFMTMARAPVPFVFGNGRARIQPIHVDDLVDAVARIIEGDRFDNTAMNIGGSQVVTIEELIRQIRQKITGQTIRSVFHFPLMPLSAVLRGLEPIALDVLPFTAGQLTSFKCDGVADPNFTVEDVHLRLRTLDKMINDLIQAERGEEINENLCLEAQRMGERITGSIPPESVIHKYVEAHRQAIIVSDFNRCRFERLILGAAKHGALFHLVEAYSAVFHRDGLLRKKLVLLTAILECFAESRTSFDLPESKHLIGFLCGLALRSLKFSLALLISIPIFLPLQLLFKSSGKETVEES